MTFVRKHLWWIVLAGSVLAATLGSALLVQARDDEAFATRGWTLATTEHDLPVRLLPIAGINVELTQYDTDELPAQLDAIADLGFVQVRQPILWEAIEPEQGAYDWSVYDPIIQAVNDHPQLELIAVLDGTPRWARANTAPDHPFAPPASAAAFGNFAGTFAAQYQNEIDYYQIWDEPNLRSHWGNTDPQPAIYSAMLRAAYTQIHDNDPNATVITAAFAPTVERGPANYNEIEYLNALYTHGAADFFDAVAGKPYGYNTGPYDRNVGNGTFNFSRLILMREAMVAQGDGDKPIWASNFGWNHLPSEWQGPPSIWGEASSTDQVQFTAEAYQRAQNEWPWLAGMILQHWQPDAPLDDPIQGFAVAPSADRWSGVINPPDALLPGFHIIDPENPYQSFDGLWQFGPLGADALPIDESIENPDAIENRAEITFYGTDFALLVRRYDVITGYYIVLIDGEPANALPRNRQDEAQIVLKSVSSGESLDLIEVATGLDEGIHTATIIHRPRQGDDAWGLAGIGVAVAPNTSSDENMQMVAYGMILFGVLGAVFSLWRLPWHTIRFPSRESLQNSADLLLTLSFSAVFVVGSALTWADAFSAFMRRDPPALVLTLATVGVAFVSPVAIVSVLALVAFGVVVFNRPLMGILATLFWSMFFSSTVDAYIRLITVVEAMLIISLAAISGRGLYEWIKHRRQAERPQWILNAMLTADKGLRSLHPIDIGVMSIGALALFSITWAELRPEAIHELRVMIIGPLLFYALLRSVPMPAKDITLLVDTAVIGGTTIAVIGLFNFISGDDIVVTADGSRRLLAVYGSPNAVALQLGRCLPFALAYVVLPVSPWRRAFGTITAGLIGLAFLLTQSLGGIVVGLPITLAAVLLAWQGRGAVKYVIGMGVAGLVALVPLSRVIPRLQNLTDFNSATTVFRLNVWRSTIEMLQDNPLTGVGLDQFLYAYRSRYIVPEGSADPNLSHPHNILLEHWVRFGILGVLALLFIQWHFWRTVLGLLRPTHEIHINLRAVLIGCVGSMAYILGHGIVDATMVFINLSYFYMLVLGLVVLLQQYVSRDEAISSVKS